MVGDLLQLARLDETGGVLAARTDVDLDEVVAAEAAGCGRSASRWTTPASSAARVQGDRAALGASRAQPGRQRRPPRPQPGGRGGRRPRATRPSSGSTTTAPAWPPRDRERVFERFTRLDEGRRAGRAAPGWGWRWCGPWPPPTAGRWPCSTPPSAAPASRSPSRSRLLNAREVVTGRVGHRLTKQACDRAPDGVRSAAEGREPAPPSGAPRPRSCGRPRSGDSALSPRRGGSSGCTVVSATVIASAGRAARSACTSNGAESRGAEIRGTLVHVARFSAVFVTHDFQSAPCMP